jgi:preprotein translocase subunit YajC
MGALLVFMLFMGRGKKKDALAHDQMLKALNRNDKIVTRGGIIGVITEARDDEIVVKIDENNNTKVRMKRWAVAGLVSKENKDGPAEPPADEKSAG